MSNPILKMETDYVQISNDLVDELDTFEIGIVAKALRLIDSCNGVPFRDLCLAVSMQSGIQVSDIKEVLTKALEIKGQSVLVKVKPAKVKQAANNLRKTPPKIAEPRVNAAWMHDAKARFPELDMVNEYTRMMNWYTQKTHKAPTVSQAEQWMQKQCLNKPMKGGIPPTCRHCGGRGRIQETIRGIQEYVPCPVCQPR